MHRNVFELPCVFLYTEYETDLLLKYSNGISDFRSIMPTLDHKFFYQYLSYAEKNTHT